jgi:hypothetical protein
MTVVGSGAAAEIAAEETAAKNAKRRKNRERTERMVKVSL